MEEAVFMVASHMIVTAHLRKIMEDSRRLVNYNY
jgi:hypothetical protein